MTKTHKGVYGAKVQSWKKANPRDILRRLIEQNPGHDEVALERLCWQTIKDDPESPDLMKTIFSYWFANNWRSLVDERYTPAQRQEKRQAKAKAAVAREVVVTKVATKMVERIMDMAMPNGKSMSECTFGYVGKLGGGFTRIAKLGKPNQIVGKVLDEAKIRKAFNG